MFATHRDFGFKSPEAPTSEMLDELVYESYFPDTNACKYPQ